MNVDRIREALSDPLELCRALGLDEGMKRQAGGVLIRCPWHRDGAPSCSVTLGGDGTVRARCFGCGATGDAFGLGAIANGLDVKRDFPRVLALLADLAGVRLEDQVASSPPSPRPPRPRAPTPSGPPEDSPEQARARAAVRAVAAVVLHLGRLDEGSPCAGAVEAYLEARGLRPEAQRAGLAGLPAGPGLAVLAQLLEDVLPGELAAAGLARGDAFAFPDHRLVIPWRGPDGVIEALQRRALRGDAEPRYVFGRGVSPRWPFGVEALASAPPSTSIAFVEGALDVLAARALFRRESVDRMALGLPGLAGWRPHFAELARGRVAFIGFDADPAGDAAAERIAAELERAGAVHVLRARPTVAKDWAGILESEVA